MWFRELLPGWGNRPLQEGGLGRFRFLVLVVYIFWGMKGREEEEEEEEEEEDRKSVV